MIRFIVLFAMVLLTCSPAMAAEFSQAVQQAHLQECTGGDTRHQSYCACTLKELQQRMSEEEYKALAALSEEEVINDARFNASISACSGYFR